MNVTNLVFGRVYSTGGNKSWSLSLAKNEQRDIYTLSDLPAGKYLTFYAPGYVNTITSGVIKMYNGKTWVPLYDGGWANGAIIGLFTLNATGSIPVRILADGAAGTYSVQSNDSPLYAIKIA